ncbi:MULTISPECIES: hypothetical protein [Streptomyces]|uniref:Uncharacterized protein n=1 Tax=Streptomyces yunnanensis TaxID=156453 RepID=A0A9X8N0H7_9ACTN|nr:hypothetical protein [Streptomyces yunnanensis]SHM52197.1 hypothetical protein SAMN05216268_111292 [Streptomyces yunnanensis]
MAKFKTLSQRAAGTALALVALVAPAVAPAAAAGKPPREGTYCSPWAALYGKGRYTYADVRVCLRTTSFGLTQVWLQTDRVTYWQGIWYSADNVEAAQITVNVEVKKDGQWLDNSEYLVRQGRRKDEFHLGDFEQRECGTYWIAYKYQQTGPYYSADKAIDEPWHGSQVEVPCTS